MFEIRNHHHYKLEILSVECHIVLDNSLVSCVNKISLISVFLVSVFSLVALLKIYYGNHIINGPLKRESYIFEKIELLFILCVLEQIEKLSTTTSQKHFHFS